ncbi:MAG: hypothetical protein N2Z22_00960 [Turneriella sp.]|nr:hypothetical protein [Turneriella sp.]
MKPLDLNVSIQNTYEAARVEAVRLEREHVQNQLFSQEALREQLQRDMQVNPPEAKILSENLLYAESYENATLVGDRNSRRQSAKKQRHNSPASVDTSSDNQEQSGTGFSTYA